MKKLVCKKCGCENVSVSIVAEQKKRGCLAACGWILLACCTGGLILLIPLLTKKGSKKKKYAVCQECGHSWKV